MQHMLTIIEALVNTPAFTAALAACCMVGALLCAVAWWQARRSQ